MKTKESEIFEPSQKCCFRFECLRTFGSKTGLPRRRGAPSPPPRRQYAVEQILNAHSQIFLQHPLMLILRVQHPFKFGEA